MKRSPLKRTTGLARGGRLERRTRIKPVSKKRRAENRERKANAIEAFGEMPRCARPGCPRLADAPHEIKTRSRGGSITDMSNCVPLCNPCNGEIGSEAAWAYELGLLKHSWDKDGGE